MSDETPAKVRTASIMLDGEETISPLTRNSTHNTLACTLILTRLSRSREIALVRRASCDRVDGLVGSLCVVAAFVVGEVHRPDGGLLLAAEWVVVLGVVAYSFMTVAFVWAVWAAVLADFVRLHGFFFINRAHMERERKIVC